MKRSVMVCGGDQAIHGVCLPPAWWDLAPTFCLDFILTGSVQNNGELLNRDNWLSNHT